METTLPLLLDGVCALCREVGSFIEIQCQTFDPGKVEFKGPHDYVSYVDKTAEKSLVKGLEFLLPEAGFLTEEGTSSKKGSRFTWIIDPLDGTTNFIHGIPFYAISIALQDKLAQKAIGSSPLLQDGEVVLGVIYHISLKEMFCAITGKPAMCNGKTIQVSSLHSLENALLATGFPYYNYQRLGPYMNLLSYTMQHTAGIRRLGSAALDLAYVACGRCELFYEYGLKPWDVAAGQFLVKQAGGTVCDFKDQANYLHGQEIVASNGAIHLPFMQVLHSYMNE